MKKLFVVFFYVYALVLASGSTGQAQSALEADNSTLGEKQSWMSYGADFEIENAQGNPTLRTQGDSQVFWGAPKDRSKVFGDVTVEADVFIERADVSAGIMVRVDKQVQGNAWNGYFASCRTLSAGYSVVQLFRFPDFKLLQEARVRGTVAIGQPIHLKVTCQGPNFWVWAGDMSASAITEFDENLGAPGFVGFKADGDKAAFSRFRISSVGQTPRKPLVKDWSGVKGAIFITSDSVNSHQMWDQYKPETVERELFYARFYGLNTVQVYLNFACWQKYREVYLQRIEDFLRRAHRHGLKTTFIFFDDVGNIEPPHLAPYAPPVPGVHNSQMMGTPGRDIIDNHYPQSREQLKKYVREIVGAHKNDARISFWQTYNEPSHATTIPLLQDSYEWIKQTGSLIPISATGGGAFFGSYFSDFPTNHSYLSPDAPSAQNMVLGDGGAEHLCTETLNRPGVDMTKLVSYFAPRRNGWIVWEQMIGRDNCRFPWGSPPGAKEPAVPFHGLIYPDGHPWSLEDIEQIRGKNARVLPVFQVQYFSDTQFRTLKKTSIVPSIDFRLNSEPSTASIDASAGIGDTKWSTRYRGQISVKKSGIYKFSANSDGIVRFWLDGKQILHKTEPALRKRVIASVQLKKGTNPKLVLEYSHQKGPAILNLKWSGPDLEEQLLLAR